MAIYAVGDIQGCYQPLRELLRQVDFDPCHDVLWCCGDLVNRGNDSLAVLRYLKSLGESCICVLGNHDLQLLVLAAGGKSYKGDTLDGVLAAPDADSLIEWLRFRPMLHHDAALAWSMVHAGFHPLWSLAEHQTRANALERMLQSSSWAGFCLDLQQKSFPTQDSQDDRLLFTAAVMTRSRYCQADGIFEWKTKTAEHVDGVLRPWFCHEKLAWAAESKVVYGHWAAKGVVSEQKHVLGLDSGCVWGGALTLARLDMATPQLFSVACEQCQPIAQ